jgi:hypothetical protein
MTPEEWILVNYKYTGDKIDFVELKKLYADYCKDGSNIKYREFKFKITRVKFDNAFVYNPVIYILGKQRCSVMIKIVPKAYHKC